MPLHEGHLFGIVNKIINLFVCIALLVAIGMGFVSWINRTKNTAVKVPHRVKNQHLYHSSYV
ncbi:PepSY domain-containing protein [Staphylococcus aureus]|nr:PepSY domain-containing protein [Staphylococcus aureus]